MVIDSTKTRGAMYVKRKPKNRNKQKIKKKKEKENRNGKEDGVKKKGKQERNAQRTNLQSWDELRQGNNEKIQIEEKFELFIQDHR